MILSDTASRYRSTFCRQGMLSLLSRRSTTLNHHKFCSIRKDKVALKWFVHYFILKRAKKYSTEAIISNIYLVGAKQYRKLNVKFSIKSRKYKLFDFFLFAFQKGELGQFSLLLYRRRKFNYPRTPCLGKETQNCKIRKDDCTFIMTSILDFVWTGDQNTLTNAFKLMQVCLAKFHSAEVYILLSFAWFQIHSISCRLCSSIVRIACCYNTPDNLPATREHALKKKKKKKKSLIVLYHWTEQLNSVGKSTIQFNMIMIISKDFMLSLSYEHT